MPADEGSLKVYLLDVGQGDCTFIVPPAGQGHPILFDCADLYTAERFVANHEIDRLAAVVASHLDVDHVRGLLSFLRNHFGAGRRVDRLVLGLDRIPRPERNRNLQALLEQALIWEQRPPHDGFALEPPFRTDLPLLLASGAGWKVELVLPWYGSALNSLATGGREPNLCSAVLRIERRGTAVLVGGDAPLGSWERLEPGLRGARAIRAPHHGGEIRARGRGWTEFADLYEAVQARFAAVSVGTHNGHGHPFPEHMAAVRRGQACRVLCTQLTPRCHDEPQTLRETALMHAGLVEWPYRHRVVHDQPASRPQTEVPCAGSIVIWLAPDGEMQVEPRAEANHDQLLIRVDHPLCGHGCARGGPGGASGPQPLCSSSS